MDVARVVGYAGFPRSELEDKMKDLVERIRPREDPGRRAPS